MRAEYRRTHIGRYRLSLSFARLRDLQRAHHDRRDQKFGAPSAFCVGLATVLASTIGFNLPKAEMWASHFAGVFALMVEGMISKSMLFVRCAAYALSAQQKRRRSRHLAGDPIGVRHFNRRAQAWAWRRSTSASVQPRL
jgi:hypothetical protein